MGAISQKNAVERRLDYLGGIWNEFVLDSKSKMLRWLVQPDEYGMVELLFDLQNEEAGDIPDLFIKFKTPFTDTQQFGLNLADELNKQYEDIRKDIGAEGIPSDWECPVPAQDETDKTTLLNVCSSFCDYYKDTFEKLVVYLTPEKVSDINEYQVWLLSFLRSGLPGKVRLTIIDYADKPQFDLLCRAETTLVTTVEPKLDMSDAYEELAEQPQCGGPGVKFRRHYVALLNASTKGDLKKAEQSAASALKIAKKQDWTYLQTAVHMALGATYLNQKNINESLHNYYLAKEYAIKSEESGNPAGPKLVVQTMFAIGSALVNNAKFEDAAKAYLDIVPLTTKLEDHLLTLESWRMAAYCYESVNNVQEAWRCGNAALDAGEKLDVEMRKNTTLPYVGQGLLRLIKKGKVFQDTEKKIRQRMNELVGADWEEKLETGVSTV